MMPVDRFLVLTMLCGCARSVSQGPTSPAPTQPSVAPAVVQTTPPPTPPVPPTTPRFDLVRYAAVYNGQPYQSLDLTVQAGGHAVLHFAGNTASPLFPRVGRADREGQVTPSRLGALAAALDAAHLDTLTDARGAMPMATQHVWVTARGATVEREFALYEAPAAWQPAARALQGVVADLLGP